jgi:hypothetical protein
MTAREDLIAAGRADRAAREAARRARDQLRQAALNSAAEGMPEAEVARLGQVARGTVRAWRAEAR